ncbi:hypothetical protein PIB30_108231 [Stylosanthes scabra]|uniref:Uncharacterized protein n=1 Tax=Stylosanthes scabra TaxID=79078 RepID=A0ABU6RZU4_9FABA|nr:hypothetical protein [Stylosanthes scabra]
MVRKAFTLYKCGSERNMEGNLEDERTSENKELPLESNSQHPAEDSKNGVFRDISENFTLILIQEVPTYLQVLQVFQVNFIQSSETSPSAPHYPYPRSSGCHPLASSREFRALRVKAAKQEEHAKLWSKASVQNTTTETTPRVALVKRSVRSTHSEQQPGDTVKTSVRNKHSGQLAKHPE